MPLDKTRAGSLIPLRMDSNMLTPVATRRPSITPDQPTRDPWFADQGQSLDDTGYRTAPRRCQVGAQPLRFGRGVGIPRVGRSPLAQHGLPLVATHRGSLGVCRPKGHPSRPVGVDEVEDPIRPTLSFPAGNHPSPGERIEADDISPMAHDEACYCFRTGSASPSAPRLGNRRIPMCDKKGRL